MPPAITSGRVSAMTLPLNGEKQIFWSDQNWASKYYESFKNGDIDTEY